MSEINRRVDQYEQIYGNPWNTSNVEEVPAHNLAWSGWQEVPAEIFVSNESSVIQASHEVLREQPLLRLPHFEGLDEPIPLDAEGLAEYMLFVIPGQTIPLRSAFGQYFLFQDGRVFSRELPGAELVPQGAAQR